MKNIKGKFAPYFRGFLALFALSNCQKRDVFQDTILFLVVD